MVDVEALRARAEERLSQGDLAGAFALVLADEAALADQEGVAALHAELLSSDPARPTLRAEAWKLIERWGGVPVVSYHVVEALLRAAERHAPDEPPLDPESDARAAAGAAMRVLEALGERRDDPAIGPFVYAQLGNALRLAGPGEDARALEALTRATQLAPANGGFWFDLGVLHKWRGRFQPAYECFLRAQSRLGDTRAVLVNLAVSATAIGDGDVAGLCFKKLGFPVSLNPQSGAPVVEGLPALNVRVLSRGAGYGFEGAVPDRAAAFELVQVLPISPCHGVVASATFRDAPIDFGDTVLFDAMPVARTSEGPVFPLLEVLRRGDERRFRFVGLQHASGDVEALHAALPEGTVIVVHREQVEMICPHCASGDAWKKHEHAPAEEHRIVYGKLIIPATVALPLFRAALDKAIRERGKVSIAVPALYEALGDAKRAGQEHQAWRGIERNAIKKGLAGATA